LAAMRKGPLADFTAFGIACKPSTTGRKFQSGRSLKLAYPVRCQSRSRVSPVAAVEFFIRGG
jgi:hypothetical protein